MSTAPATRNLFVYGTLRSDPGHELFHVLARHSVFLGQAAVQGRLFDLGDYPGMLYPERGQVIGEVYAVNAADWDSVISRLDEYEGCTQRDPEPHEYRREVIDAQLSSGHRTPAWAYILNRLPATAREIPSGDYLSWRTKLRAQG